MNTTARLSDASGGPTSKLLPARSPIQLSTTIWLGFAAPDRPVKDVMDTQNRDGSGFLCYKYDKYAEGYMLDPKYENNLQV